MNNSKLYLDLNQNEDFTFSFKVSARKLTKQEQEIVLQSQTVAQLDEKLSNTEKSSLTSLRVFVLSESLSEKLAVNLDSLFLNSLFVNSKLDIKKLSSCILNDYLHVQEMVRRYNKKLGVERKLVCLIFDLKKTTGLIDNEIKFESRPNKNSRLLNLTMNMRLHLA
jgi:hypothetical protein